MELLPPKNRANHVSLSPISFLERTAVVHPDRLAVVYGGRRFTWLETERRCRLLASALLAHSVRKGDTVAVVAPNVPAAYEAQFGVPMAGAVLNAINIRLDARTIGFFLVHAEVRVVVVDVEFFPLVEEALGFAREKGEYQAPLLVVVEDGEGYGDNDGRLERALGAGAVEYEEFLRRGDEGFRWQGVEDEWESISLCYTSGTTSSPKGVVTSHRGGYLSSLSNILDWRVHHYAVYLWTLPLFHCNGWCFAWVVAAVAGTNVCLRQVTAKGIFSAIAEHGVTHFCAAPVVLNTIINSAPHERQKIKPGVEVMTAGAAPPAYVLAKMEEDGFRVTHTYGLSETYGPCTVCAWKPEWDSLSLQDRARLKARQGVRYTLQEGLDVVNPDTMVPIPADGNAVGEIVIRGNLVMKGYLKNPAANEESFRGGWYHTGDLAVKHADGYVEIKDRSKDIIISGGENISSLEVESALYRHPAVLEASVVARPDDQWGESPCAFVTLKENFQGGDNLANDIMAFARTQLPRYTVPRTVVFGQLPKTATGKIQKHILRDRAKALGPVPKPALNSRL